MRSILLAAAALLAIETAAHADWYLTLKMAPTECLDASTVDPTGSVYSPAGIIEIERRAGLRAQLSDKGDIVDVIVQNKDGQLVNFLFYRSLDACQANVGYLKDRAPTGSDLENYR